MRTRNRLGHSSLLALAALATNPATADETRSLVIEDQNGEPLEGAVVTLPGMERNARSLADSQPDPAVMDQVDKTFEPLVLAVTRGTEVIFPNSDNIRHHVYSFSPIKTFELKLYSGTPDKPIRFDESGTAVLGCNIHDFMTGYIRVVKGEDFWQSNAQGRLTLPTAAAGPVALWHPWIQAEGQVLRRELTAGPDPRTLRVAVDRPSESKRETHSLRNKFQRFDSF